MADGGYLILDFGLDQTPLPGWMNRYTMYSMWWIIIWADYYELTGTACVMVGLPV